MILPFAPVFKRRAADVFMKGFSKITAASQPAGVADIGYRILPVRKHPTRNPEPVISDVVSGRRVQAAAENTVAFPFT